MSVIGLDIGSSAIRASVLRHGTPVDVAVEREGDGISSAVAISSRGRLLLGRVAEMQALTNRAGTVVNLRGTLGLSWGSARAEAARRTSAAQLRESPSGEISWEIAGQEWMSEELLAMLIRTLKESAANTGGARIESCVLNVPAEFTPEQRRSAVDACRIAGIDVLSCINDACATAAVWAGERPVSATIAVVDVGTAGIRCNIVDVDAGCIALRARAASAQGVRALEDAIAKQLLESLTQLSEAERQAPMIQQRVIESARRVAEDLSTEDESLVHVPFIGVAEDGRSVHLKRSFTSDEFEELYIDILHGGIGACRDALAMAEIEADSLDAVLICGRGANYPGTQDALTWLFHQPCEVLDAPIGAAARGAALIGDALVADSSRHVVLDAAPFEISVTTPELGASVVVPAFAPLPFASSVRLPTSRDGQSSMKMLVEYCVPGHSRSILGDLTLSGFGGGEAGRDGATVRVEMGDDFGIRVSAKVRDDDAGRRIVRDSTPPLGAEAVAAARKRLRAATNG